jgi:cyclase
MFRPRVIPCLLLKNKGLVKTVNFENPTYIGDPINAVRIFNDFEADELVFLDIDASREDRCINFEFVKRVGGEAFMPFSVGGGIKNLEQIKNLLKFGADKVIIGENAVKNPNLVKEASETFGSQSIIVCLDVKKIDGKYSLFIDSGKINTGICPKEFSKKIEKMGCGEIIINSIDLDGIMKGYDLKLIKSISNSLSIPVIALGGAGNEEDLFEGFNIGGASGLAAGSLFVYSGGNKGILINYPDKGDLNSLFLNGNFK